MEREWQSDGKCQGDGGERAVGMMRKTHFCFLFQRKYETKKKKKMRSYNQLEIWSCVELFTRPVSSFQSTVRTHAFPNLSFPTSLNFIFPLNVILLLSRIVMFEIHVDKTTSFLILILISVRFRPRRPSRTVRLVLPYSHD